MNSTNSPGVSQAIVGFIVIAIILAVALYPVARIARRAGYSRLWCLMYLVPVANLIVLWIFAYADWPALEDDAY